MNEGGIWRSDVKPNTLLKPDGASVGGDPVPANQLLSLCVCLPLAGLCTLRDRVLVPGSSQPAAAQLMLASRWNLGASVDRQDGKRAVGSRLWRVEQAWLMPEGFIKPWGFREGRQPCRRGAVLAALFPHADPAHTRSRPPPQRAGAGVNPPANRGRCVLQRL